MNRFVSFLILSCIALVANAQTIELKADTLKGCGSLKVTFTNISTGLKGTEKWTWFVKDKAIVLKDIEPQLFDSAGVYKIILKGYDIDNQALGTDTATITVRPKLNSYFAYSDTTGDRAFAFYAFKNKQTPSDLIFTHKWTYINDSTKNPVLGTDNTPVVVKTFPAEGIYRVFHKVTDSWGCSDSIIQKIGVADNLKAPNIFTPNNDGKNDYFSVLTNDDNTYILYIFTRTGQLVYKSEAPSILWDGNDFSGSPAETGTYFYTIETSKGLIKKNLSGFVILNR